MLRLSKRMEQIIVRVYGRKEKEVELAKKLGISKQAVSKTLKEARSKLTEIFIRLSEILNSDIIKINVEKGYAILRNRQTGKKIYIFYVPGYGPQTLFEDKIECNNTNKSICTRIMEAALQWGIINNIDRDLNKMIEKIISEIEK